jgi:hypothetical protein
MGRSLRLTPKVGGARPWSSRLVLRPLKRKPDMVVATSRTCVSPLMSCPGWPATHRLEVDAGRALSSDPVSTVLGISFPRLASHCDLETPGMF